MGSVFEQSAGANRSVFVPYLTVGYPSVAASSELFHGLAEAGAGVIELGIPFSDPMADGPTIQHTSQVALDGGTRIDDVFRVLEDFRASHGTAVVLFTYLNAPWARGVEAFVEEAASAGADGLLLTDLPLGSDPDLEDRLESGPLDLVRLIAPHDPERAGGAHCRPESGVRLLRLANGGHRRFVRPSSRPGGGGRGLEGGGVRPPSPWGSASPPRIKPDSWRRSPTAWWWAVR